MKFSIRRFNEWLIVVLFAILVPVLFSFVRGGDSLLPYNWHYIFNPHPSTVLIGLAAVDAIEMFGGGKPAGFSIIWETASMYLNVVLYLMIGPYLLLMGYRKAILNENRSKPWYWYIGAVICIGSLSVIPTELLKQKVFSNTKESAAESRTKDLMRAELAEVGFATAQHEILQDGVDESFQVEDLNMEGLKFQHEVESVQSDTLITLVASTPEQPDYQVTMEVRPYNRSVLKQRN
ncbi:hypothetical protein [Gracilimonas sp. BCB1]|uniref:hypothetical protein n=1 Tax=Gracilimonas sp. BCB1 TaxID=3152362 RepID=UPI0032D9AA97